MKWIGFEQSKILASNFIITHFPIITLGKLFIQTDKIL